MNFRSVSAVVLAGGKGKRLNSKTPKVLNEIGGRPMVFYSLEKLINLGIKDIIVVIGYKASEVQKATSFLGFNFKYALQKKPLGTGDATKAALKKVDKKTKTLLVVNGDDSAFYKVSSLKSFLNSHFKTKATISLLTLLPKKEKPIARVIRNLSGEFMRILEYNEYVKSSAKSKEINCGAYIFDAKWLKENINNIKKNSLTGEYYITQLLEIAKDQHQRINLHQLKNEAEWVGVNTQAELHYANNMFIKSKGRNSTNRK